MPTTYQFADEDLLADLGRVMARWHPRLNEAGVKVGVLLASNPDGPAVVGHGYPALACIRVVSLRDRVAKQYDAEMLIDEAAYRDLRGGQKLATLDHELSHIDTVDLTKKELRQRDAGDACTWKTDDLGRPKLKTVKGDWNGGDGFAAVVERHGGDAIEYENIARCKARTDAARREADRGKGGA